MVPIHKSRRITPRLFSQSHFDRLVDLISDQAEKIVFGGRPKSSLTQFSINSLIIARIVSGTVIVFSRELPRKIQVVPSRRNFQVDEAQKVEKQ